jgi:hypothetical protein
MRQWHCGWLAVGCLTVAVVLGPRLWSGDKANEPVKAAAAPAAAQIAKNRIDKVVVYPNSALVTREVEVPGGNGLIELTVAPMPEHIVPNTLYTEGNNGIRILTTRFSTRQVLEDTSEERRKLEAEKEKLDVVTAKLDSEMNACLKNMELLVRLEGTTDKSKLTGDEIIAVSKYVMEQRTEKAKEMVSLKDQKRLNDIKLNFVQRKMGELGQGRGRMEREAVIVVDRENGKGGQVRLNYLVDAVTWRPEYKVRAGKAAEDVQLDYMANLMQHSGEDWQHVKMTLSTAQPMLNASPPELAMLQPILAMRGTPGGPPMPGAGGPATSPFANKDSVADLTKKAMTTRDQANSIGGFQGGFGGSSASGGFTGGAGPPPGPGGGFQGQGGNILAQQKVAEKLLNEASAWEQNLDLMCTREDILARLRKEKGKNIAMNDPTNKDGPSVTYHLPNKLTVPSRGEEQVLEVAKLNLKPKYYYKTVPVLNTHVYRLADLVNNSTQILLPGEATMYQGTDFVGRMPMPLVAIGEEFTAGFGADTQLQVQRQMVDQTRSTQGGNQVITYNYRLLVSSFKSDPVQLQVWDRLPKGENNESVGINLLKTSPDLSKDGIYQRESRPNNLLRWDVEVAPNCNGEKALPITYEFRMELDKQMAITGFQSR